MDKTEVIRVLDEAKQLIIEKGWAQGYYAKDAEGRLVDTMDPEACSFCIAGAISRVQRRSSHRTRTAVFDAVRAVTPNEDIAAYNDAWGRTKEEVIDLFDQAKEWVNGQI